MSKQTFQSELAEILNDYKRYIRADHKTTTHIGLDEQEAQQAINHLLVKYAPGEKPTLGITELTPSIVIEKNKFYNQAIKHYKNNMGIK